MALSGSEEKRFGCGQTGALRVRERSWLVGRESSFVFTEMNVGRIPKTSTCISLYLNFDRSLSH